MSVQQIITLAISTVALVVSLISIILQYQIRVDLKYRVTEVSLYALSPPRKLYEECRVGANRFFL